MNTNAFQLQFTLKQHTPIIHFQHEQDGATLRATEVKPKLDRFIIEKCKQQNIDYKKWLIGKGEHEALNYKLKIEQNPNISEVILQFHKNTPMYFGNMGSENPPKHLKQKEETLIEIFSFDIKLKEEIEKYLCDFFFHNNFGTRQSKGYGSFEVISICGNKVNFTPLGYNFSFRLNTGNLQEALYKTNLFYRALRSGLNEVSNISYEEPSDKTNAHKQQRTKSKFYFKPLIFLYAKHLQKQWDKKTIKQSYFNFDYSYRRLSNNEKRKNEIAWKFNDIEYMEELALKKQIEKHENSDILTYPETNIDNHFFLDFKDIFGLSSTEEWKSYGKTIIKKNATNNSTIHNFIKKTGDQIIDRFKSPLFFKIIKTKNNEFTIYVSYHELPSNYKGQKFIIYNNKNENNPRLCLQIPPNFLFSQFFEFIFDNSNFNINTHVLPLHKTAVDNNNFNTNYFETLKSIFEQLQNKSNA